MINVTCAIILKENLVLVTQRSEKMKLPLKWEFPGGKLEGNESAEDCIHRELKEELNIEVSISKRLKSHEHDYGNFKINLIPFLVNYSKGELILAEHKDFLWCEKTDLLKLDWAEADIPILMDFIKQTNA